MRKILCIGLFLCAAALAAPHRASATADPGVSHRPGSCGALSLATYGPAEVGRDYGFMLIAIAMPTAVLGWGVRRTARERAKAEV